MGFGANCPFRRREGLKGMTLPVPSLLEAEQFALKPRSNPNRPQTLEVIGVLTDRFFSSSAETALEKDGHPRQAQRDRGSNPPGNLFDTATCSKRLWK
jgi:hypothetical protein